ncbi:MAG: sodium-dependent transporter [Pseudobdellovibrionaceae bacterium]
MKKLSWRTKFGFYLVAVGSACGLGNLWRFPYIVGENGGGAFVLLYVLLAFVVGAPLLISELTLGKLVGTGILPLTQKISKTQKINFRWVGYSSLILSLVVLGYYAVISGWVLYFMTQFVVSLVQESGNHVGHIDVLLRNGWLQFALASVHLIFTVLVVNRGIHEGLEKWINYVMPIFVLMVAILVIRVGSLSVAPDVFRFLFYPDFSKLTLSSMNHALGHVFFTLSIGFGVMVTFGSYMKPEDHTPTAGFRVSIVDTIASLVALLLVFPLVFQIYNKPVTDPAILFQVLPGFLNSFTGGKIFGVLFFVCLYLAALNASIGLLEGIHSNTKSFKIFPGLFKKIGFENHNHLNVWLSGLLALVLAAVPSLVSMLFFNHQGQMNTGLIELLDSVLINWVLPVVAFGVSLVVCYGFKESEIRDEFMSEKHMVSTAMYPHWRFSIRWLTPAIIAIGLILQIVDILIKKT